MTTLLALTPTTPSLSLLLLGLALCGVRAAVGMAGRWRGGGS